MINIEQLCPGCMQFRADRTKPCPHCGYSEETARVKGALPVFSILAGRYLLGCPLGKGGFGITYMALDLPTEETVAVKEYFPSELVVRDEDGESVLPIDESKALYFRTGMRSFSEEGRLLSLFSDTPGIVRFRDLLHVNRTSYLIMDYAAGTPLRKYMRRRNAPIAEAEALALMKPILEALCVMHQKGVLHRDISPENLILSSDGKLTLIDFGAAREYSLEEEENLTVILKRGYAPEEQYHSGSRQGPWTDLYAACAVLYHMLTNELPQDAEARVENDQLTPLSLRRDVQISRRTCAALEKGLQVDPIERYPDIPALMRDLYSPESTPASAEVPPASKEAPAQAVPSAPEPDATSDSDETVTIPIPPQRASAPVGAASAPQEPQAAKNDKQQRQKPASSRRARFPLGLLAALIAAVCFVCFLSSLDRKINSSGDSSAAGTAVSDGYSERDKDGTLYEYDSEGHLVKQTSPVSNDYDDIMQQDWLGGEGICTTWEYDDNGNEMKKTWYRRDGSVNFTSETEYDDNGRKVKSTDYDADGSVTGWTEANEYSADGQVTKQTSYDADGSVNGWSETEYDVNGNRTRLTRYGADGSVDFCNEYDDDGNITQTNYADDGSVDFCYEYDADGNITRQTYYVNDGSVAYYIVYEYNSDGREIAKTSYEADDSVFRSELYDYDDKGRLIKITVNDDSVLEAEYDETDHVAKVTTYYLGNVWGWVEYERDAEGYKTKKTRYDADGSVLERIEFEYNDNSVSSDCDVASSIPAIPSDAEGSDLSTIRSNGVLRIGVTDFEPMDYQDKDGNWVGFDADMASAFAESLHVEAQFVECDWDGIFTELNNQLIDCVWNGVTVTEERKRSFALSLPYTVTPSPNEEGGEPYGVVFRSGSNLASLLNDFLIQCYEDGTMAACAEKYGLQVTLEESATAKTTAETEYNGHAYELFDESMSWTAAEAFCEGRGGHLVTITSAEENDAMVSLMQQGSKGYYYIGYSDIKQTGDWKWITGEASGYANWDPEKPEPSQGEGQYYAMIVSVENPPRKQTGEWADIPDKNTDNRYSDGYYAYTNSGFICEYEACCPA